MDFMEIFTLVTGVIYIILEIRQKNLMWAIGVLTSVAAMVVFFRQGLYASFGLNTYYLVMSFIGLWQWNKDKRKLYYDSVLVTPLLNLTFTVTVTLPAFLATRLPSLSTVATLELFTL